MEKTNFHQSVLLNESIEALAIKPDGIYIDATFGRGGHSKAILEKLGPQGKLIAIDKDPSAIAYATQLYGHDLRFKIYHASFASLQQIADEQQISGQVDGILLDLGLSSPQLDEPARGFSFMQEGPLDMRMDTTKGIDAKTWINSAAAEEIAVVLREYGEERFAKRIAGKIVEARQQQTIATTAQLAQIVKDANPAWEKHKHPATRSFQAIRIFINQELQDLEQVLQTAYKILSISGRLVVISFHSLEDRIVKHFLRAQEQGMKLPAKLPVRNISIVKNMRRIGKAIKPTSAEIANNPRARSAILRIGEKVT